MLKIKRINPADFPENDPVSPEQEKIIVLAKTPSQRMEMIREERNLTKSDFAKSIGLTPTGYQSMIGRDSVQESVAIATEYRHGFNSKWILTGNGKIRSDQWETMSGEIEDTFLRDLSIFLSQKLKRTKPVVHSKDKNGRQFR